MALHFILDGYNVIKQTPLWADKPLRSGREALIALLEQRRPQGSARNQVTVVFDGQPGMLHQDASALVRVLFATSASADELIKSMVVEAKHKKNIIVVTNDRAIQFYVRACGAQVMRVQEFLSRIPSNSRSTARGRPHRGPKAISSLQKQRINQELEEIWLKRK